MLLAHNGEDHSTENHLDSAATADEHSGHVQSSTTTQQTDASGSNSQPLLIGGGVAFLVLAAVILVFMLRGSKKATEVVETPTE